jgi:hypothetical protein
MYGYEISCMDFIENTNKIDVVMVSFSERYCKKLGHKPLRNFENMARKILRSVSYTKGPPHAPSLLGEAPAPTESATAPLSRFMSNLENTPWAVPVEAACSG